MRHEDVWDLEAAKSYDTPGTGMFAPDVVGPTVERLAELAEGGRALEFAIGTGRVAVPLSEGGVAVSGIEMSPPMVEQLRTKVDEATIPVVIGDMATAVAPGSYTLVFLVFNGISNLLTQAEQVACFRNAARHLTPGGRFVVELWVPELRKLAPGQKAVVWQSEPHYVGLDTYDVLRQQVVSHHFRFGEARKPSCSVLLTGTSGRRSSTSWPSWRASNSRAGMRTGPRPSSRPSRVRTSPSIESPRRRPRRRPGGGACEGRPSRAAGWRRWPPGWRGC
jgi:SAM-dependent methyltransferase